MVIRECRVYLSQREMPDPRRDLLKVEPELVPRYDAVNTHAGSRDARPTSTDVGSSDDQRANVRDCHRPCVPSGACRHASVPLLEVVLKAADCQLSLSPSRTMEFPQN